MFDRLPIRDAYTLFRAVNAFRAVYGQGPDPDTVHNFRAHLRRSSGPDPLSVSLRDGWRSHSSDGESGTDYRILPEDPADPWTYEELSEYMHDSPVFCGHGYGPHDCTGRRYTLYWDYTRTPAGVVLIHQWGTDV